MTFRTYLPLDFDAIAPKATVHLVKWLEHNNISTVLHGVSYLIVTVWLFTYSDLKTIVGPQSAFGTLTALAAPIFRQPIASASSESSILLRLPITVAWTYLNLLPFTISNQRHALSVEEDAINKPWRPLPSGRLTSSQAKWLMIASYINAIVVSFYVGGLKQCLALIVLGFCYNDAGGSDVSCVLRNLINACGFTSFASGSMEVALGHQLYWTPLLLQWFILIALIIFSTVQAQDMYDIEGDKLKGRKTVPLVMTDRNARLSIAIPVALFTICCPWFWNLSKMFYLAPLILGLTVVMRTLCYRTIEADKTTFRLWNLWLVSLYCLPVLKYNMEAQIAPH